MCRTLFKYGVEIIFKLCTMLKSLRVYYTTSTMLQEIYRIFGGAIQEHPIIFLYQGKKISFPTWRRTYIEFSEFNEYREADKLLKHEFGLI